MLNILKLVAGIAVGVLIIYYRVKLSLFIGKAFDKVPKYEEGAKDLKIKFEIRPVFVGMWGVVLCLLSLYFFSANL